MINVTANSPNRRWNATGSIFLVLFGLPFAAIGLLVGVLILLLAYDDLRMQFWQEIPCQVLAAKLNDDNGTDKTTYRVTARYRYSIDGREHFGTRVTVDEGSDNIGSFQKRAYAELKQFQESGKSFRCYVNPNQPDESVLYRDARWELASFRAFAALAFGLVGFGLLGLVAVGWHNDRKQKVDANPDLKPWQLRADWARGEIRYSDHMKGTVRLLIAGVWLVMSLPCVLTSGPELVLRGNALAALGLILPGIGVILAMNGLRRRKRWMRYGDSVFTMAAIPGVIGGQLAGVIRIDRYVYSPDGFRVTLSCSRATESKSSDDDDSTTGAIWEDKRIIVRELSDYQTDASAIPVLFEIPYEIPEFREDTQLDPLTWTLQVRSITPEVDYAAEFEVPVFETPDSDPDFKADESAIADYQAPVASDAQLVSGGLRAESLPGGGTRYVFPWGRNIGFAMALSLLQIAFGAAIVAAAYYFVPAIFPYAAGLIGLVLLRAVADLFLYRSEVEVTPDGLSIRGGILRLGDPRVIAAADVGKILAENAGSVNNQILYDLSVELTNNTSVILGKRVIPHETANAIVRQIESTIRVITNSETPGPWAEHRAQIEGEKTGDKP